MSFSQEAMILFVGAVLAASIVIVALYSQVQSGINKATSVSGEIQEDVSNAFQIVNVHETNVYIRGVSGQLKPQNMEAFVDGILEDVNVVFIRDKGAADVLDPNDLMVVILPVSITEENCLQVYIGRAYDVWGNCFQ